MSVQDPRTRPVFIVGQARSGTSILFRLVLEHPSFRGPGELNLAESHVMSVIANERSIDATTTRQFAALDDEGWDALLAEVRPLRHRQRLAAALPTGLLRRSVGTWRALGGASTLQAYLRHAARGRGVERLVEKTPWHLPWARHLLAAFPDTRLLAITRDPVDTYTSHRRRAAEDPDGSWADLPVDAFIERWSTEARQILELRNDERFLDIDYVDLVGRPQAVQERIFAWLGEPPLAQLPTRVATNPYAPVSDAADLFGPIRAIERRRSDHLTEDEIDHIAACLGPLNEELRGVR